MSWRYDFEKSLGYWLVPASHALERALNEELQALGVTVRQWQVIAWLIHDGELCQAALARRLRIEGPTLKGILDRMERDGWLERRPCRDDLRRNVLRLRPEARPVWREMAAAARRVRRRALQGIDPEEFERAKSVLARVRDNLEPKEARR